ncbi:kin-20, partial [Symbiodinium microadriaticum]
PSRRDDMESLTYSLIAAARGDHPWQQHLSKSRLNNGQAGISVTRTSSGQEESGNVVITGPRRVNALSSRAYRDTTTGNNSTKGNSNIGGRDSSSSVNRRERHLRMILLRSKTPINRLCSGLPGAFAKSMSYIKSLGYQEKPDYELLRSILREG